MGHSFSKIVVKLNKEFSVAKDFYNHKMLKNRALEN